MNERGASSAKKIHENRYEKPRDVFRGFFSDRGVFGKGSGSESRIFKKEKYDLGVKTTLQKIAMHTKINIFLKI